MGDKTVKKGIIFIILLVFVVFIVQMKEMRAEETFQMIPDDAIRLRILANSDSDEDQRIKHIVRDNVSAYISELVQHIDNISEGRRVINMNVPEIEKIIEQTLQQESKSDTFTVEYSPNVSFPTKIYDDYLYPAGEYEAVLISLGEGQGANWWCVLFPPLCFLDFSNGTTVAESDEELTKNAGKDNVEVEEDDNEVEVKFFLFEWLGLS